MNFDFTIYLNFVSHFEKLKVYEIKIYGISCYECHLYLLKISK